MKGQDMGRKEQLFKKLDTDFSKPKVLVDAKKQWLKPLGDDSPAVKAEARRYGIA
jgi:hypothetical protein